MVRKERGGGARYPGDFFRKCDAFRATCCRLRRGSSAEYRSLSEHLEFLGTFELVEATLEDDPCSEVFRVCAVF